MRLRELEFERDFAAGIALWQTAGPGIHVSESDDQAEIAKKLQRDPDLFLVAEAEERVIGTVLGGFDGRRGLVYHLAVDAAWRGRGIGSALMDAVEARLIARGCHKAYLMVDGEHPEVKSFYEGRGWEVMEVLAMAKEFGA